MVFTVCNVYYIFDHFMFYSFTSGVVLFSAKILLPREISSWDARAGNSSFQPHLHIQSEVFYFELVIHPN